MRNEHRRRVRKSEEEEGLQRRVNCCRDEFHSISRDTEATVFTLSTLRGGVESVGNGLDNAGNRDVLTVSHLAFETGGGGGGGSNVPWLVMELEELICTSPFTRSLVLAVKVWLREEPNPPAFF